MRYQAKHFLIAFITVIAINLSIDAIFKLKIDIYIDVVIPIIGISLVFSTFNLFIWLDELRKENKK